MAALLALLISLNIVVSPLTNPERVYMYLIVLGSMYYIISPLSLVFII
jgi:hypothetical protein